MIELGAGIGLCGLYLAADIEHNSIFTDIVLTDLPEAMSSLNYNIELNASRARAATLRWGNSVDLSGLPLTYLPIPIHT